MLRRHSRDVKRPGAGRELRPALQDAGDEFYVLFEGDVTALPADVLARGNYVVVRAPGPSP
jgi:hypothetical protein